MLSARLDRGAMNQASNGESTVSRYCISANTAGDHCIRRQERKAGGGETTQRPDDHLLKFSQSFDFSESLVLDEAGDRAGQTRTKWL
jgi:hypothetical protein